MYLNKVTQKSSFFELASNIITLNIHFGTKVAFLYLRKILRLLIKIKAQILQKKWFILSSE
jgi:hypothetical protein